MDSFFLQEYLVKNQYRGLQVELVSKLLIFYIYFYVCFLIFIYFVVYFYIWGPIGPIWGPLGPYGAPWVHMGPHGLHGPWPMGLGRWARADWPRGPPRGGIFQGPRPMGLEDPPMGVYFRARGRWGPMGSMGLGDPPMGVSSSIYIYIYI